VLARVGFPDVVAPDAHGTWPDGTLHIHRAGISTRATEITYEDHAFQVRILFLASPEDHELAFRVVEQLSALTGAQVEPEDGEVFPAERLRDIYDTAWLTRVTESQADFLDRLVKREGHTLTLGGPVRQFHIGPRLYAQLVAAGPETEFQYRVLEAIRRVEYRDLSGYTQAAVMAVDQSMTLSVWSPDTATHFVGVDYLVLSPNNRPDGIFRIPYAALPQLADVQFAWLDEKQCLVEPVPSRDWPKVLRAAERFSTSPRERRAGAAPASADPSALRRPWWRRWHRR
jgi:hypothetical protein